MKVKKTIKGVTGKSGGVVLRKGEWEKNRPAHLASIREKQTATKNQNGGRAGAEEQYKEAIIIRRAEGASLKDLKREFEIGEEDVRRVLKHKFVDGKTGRQKLRDLLLSNAIQLGAQTRAKASDMNGMQSAVATGIMTSKFIELDKHMQNQPEEIDNASLSEIAKELKDMNDLVEDAGLHDAAPLLDAGDEDDDED